MPRSLLSSASFSLPAPSSTISTTAAVLTPVSLFVVSESFAALFLSPNTPSLPNLFTLPSSSSSSSTILFFLFIPFLHHQPRFRILIDCISLFQFIFLRSYQHHRLHHPTVYAKLAR
ncbi:uncharacterized protein UMAG_12324 [Mycosarcoma maydis]|uniref:Uncharacterized protein n=1 Tax=Mycosarcoma maydis TaxID=5270 RepID=A0A0D1DNP0_MYCMD|nr:uncharacterized protein UMAG_12324 [Ustilago maydis 521]KIS66034.1 hypothetical protein UMAG_12324 [Ustilago maydis 521]|eukprot:XP_011392525.1 hypothetical protein UMAG_12324 [Ustilago maydis 521]